MGGVRRYPLVGRKLWFGPRAWIGWGWTPVSWEGWALSIALTIAILVVAFVAPGVASFVIPLLVLALLAACILKGTAPGGPSARREFLQASDRPLNR